MAIELSSLVFEDAAKFTGGHLDHGVVFGITAAENRR
jgi:hypothetical protein